MKSVGSGGGIQSSGGLIRGRESSSVAEGKKATRVTPESHGHEHIFPTASFFPVPRVVTSTTTCDKGKGVLVVSGEKRRYETIPLENESTELGE